MAARFVESVHPETDGNYVLAICLYVPNGGARAVLDRGVAGAYARCPNAESAATARVVLQTLALAPLPSGERFPADTLPGTRRTRQGTSWTTAACAPRPCRWRLRPSRAGTMTDRNYTRDASRPLAQTRCAAVDMTPARLST